jgi:hypothetical protein
MFQVKAEGVHNGQQRTSVVLCYRKTPISSHEGEAEKLLPGTVCELLLYDLPTQPGSNAPWPLAYQEALVHRINSHLEFLRASEHLGNAVSVENDTFVDERGFGQPNLENSALHGTDGYKQQEQLSGSSTAMQEDNPVCRTLQGSQQISRMWQQTPLLPLTS